jgi:long-chain acyl-CoA synthetase
MKAVDASDISVVKGAKLPPMQNMNIWERSYPPNLGWDIALPDPVWIDSILEGRSRISAGACAIDFYGVRLSYADVFKQTVKIAAGLQMLGLKPGDRVGLHLPNTPHYIIFFFATLMAGGVVVNLSHALSGPDLKKQILDAAPRVFVTSDILRPDWQAIEGTGIETAVICRMSDFIGPAAAKQDAFESKSAQRFCEYMELSRNDYTFQPPARINPAAIPAVIQYTGGTTGDPKGVVLTHANFSAAIALQNSWRKIVPSAPPTKSLIVVPISHIAGLAGLLLPAVAAGSELILHARFDPDRVVDDILTKQIDRFFGVPTMYAVLINHSKAKELSAAGLKHCRSGGAPMSQKMRQQIMEKTGLSVVESYGMTELTGVCAAHPPGKLPRPGSVGLPMPLTAIKIIDPDDGVTEFSSSKIGEIYVSGPQLMVGYWDGKMRSWQSRGDAFFPTGDLGYLDEDGYLFLVDRKKDLIITGGYKIYPKNLEAILRAHPAVSDVAVIGVPNFELGELVKAFVTLEPGKSLTYSEMNEFLHGKVGPNEMPMSLVVRDELPRNHQGKIKKHELENKRPPPK